MKPDCLAAKSGIHFSSDRKRQGHMNRVISRLVLILGIGAFAGASMARAQTPKPKVWAIVIGIDAHDDAQIPSCRTGVRDARTIAEWFVKEAGWGERQVLRMDYLGSKTHGRADQDLSNLRPTRANLDWAIVEWLGHRVQKGDVVLIYFAGQANARPPRAPNPVGRTYLLPIDARANDIDQTGWSIEVALDKARGLGANQARVVLWLDTSPFGRGSKVLPVAKGAPTGQDWLRALTRWPRVTAWLAADGRPALEAPGGASDPFVASFLKSTGNREQAHNLLGCLKGMGDDPELAKRGFQTMGGVGPRVSLWSGGAQVVEEAVPELIVQSGHGDRVTSVIVTADNAHAITASQDSTVRVWSLADRSLLRVLTDPFVGVEALALDRDGAVLMAGDGVGRIFGWDMALDRPKPFYGPPEHQEGIQDIVFLPEGKRFVTLDKARRSFFWDGSQGSIKKLRVFSEEPLSRIIAASRTEPGGAAIAAAVETPGKGPGSIALFDRSGQPSGKLIWSGKRISALDLAADGRKVLVGDSSGTVALLEIPGGKVEYTGQFDGKIRMARFAKSGLLLVSDDRSLRLVDARTGSGPLTLTDPERVNVTGEVDRSAYSNDGRWLAACTPEGRILAWRLGEGLKADPFALPQGSTQALSPAFSPDGRLLLSGDADGGLRSWSLPSPENQGPAESRPSIAPARGKIAGLAPSPSGRYLLEITRDDLALIWDLQEGRGCKPLAGMWIGGAYLPDESKLVMARRPDISPDLVVVDRMTGETLAPRFERPIGREGRPSSVAFGNPVVSKSGKWVASASLPGQEPLACVWSIESGKLAHLVRDHDGGLTGVDLSGDEADLLTWSEDGTAKVWPLSDPSFELRKPTVILANPAEDAPAITSARFCPGKPGRVVTGTAGGFVFLWDWDKDKGKRERIDLGRLDGSINATAFSSDGRWVVASSARDKSIRFWSIPEAGPPVVVPFRPRPNHAEQVGALAGWPNGLMIVSGSDDASVRFWNLKDRALQGTLLARTRDDKAVDWLAFTPEGLFDGSMPGESMVKWRVGEKIVTLQQSEDRHHVFQLAGAFPIGEKIQAPEFKDESPRLKIASPGIDRVADLREVEIVVWTGDADPSALRLYQNGVPIKGPGDFGPGETPNFRKTKVALRRGENTFYAMASKPGAIDGRTEDRTLHHEGPDPPGRVHTLAIGVSDYKQRRLKYANADAETIAKFLESQQLQGVDKPGERVVLLDSAVNLANIEDAFRRIRDAVQGRPQDTVVLFIAGHTDTDSRNEQFCLLLPDFRFQGAPAIGEASREVTMRGNVGASSFLTRVGDPGVLPYVILYNRLSRLEALQRLIIVDACQAGAILEDPAVRNIQRLVEKGSRNARNSYLLAARRGEPASEADALKHGLLSYTLLHGLKAPGLETISPDLGGFPGKPSADLNGDGIVTTDELAEFTDDALPRLARLFPQVVMRAGKTLPPGQPPAGASAGGSPELEAKVKIQSSPSSFPLFKFPGS
jgi:WD40 repeat protein/uncharacterized caspase-like protein